MRTLMASKGQRKMSAMNSAEAEAARKITVLLVFGMYFSP